MLSRASRLVVWLSTLDEIVLVRKFNGITPPSAIATAHFTTASTGAVTPVPWSLKWIQHSVLGGGHSCIHLGSAKAAGHGHLRSFAAQAGDASTWQDDLGRSLNLIMEGSPDAARELLWTGISTAEQQLGTSNHPLVAVMYNQAAVIYLIGSMLQDAETAAREALRIIQSFYVPTSVEVAACQLRLAVVLVARGEAGEAKHLLQPAAAALSQSEQHQDSFGEALYYTGMCQLLGAHGYDAVRRVDDLLVEGLRKFGEKIDLQRPLVDVALREHALLRARAEERGEWELVEALLQQALLLVKQAGVEIQLRGLLALQLGVVQHKHRAKEEQARETFSAALEALGDTVDPATDVVQQGMKRYEVLTELLKRYSASQT